MRPMGSWLGNRMRETVAGAALAAAGVAAVTGLPAEAAPAAAGVFTRGFAGCSTTAEATYCVTAFDAGDGAVDVTIRRQLGGRAPEVFHTTGGFDTLAYRFADGRLTLTLAADVDGLGPVRLFLASTSGGPEAAGAAPGLLYSMEAVPSGGGVHSSTLTGTIGDDALLPHTGTADFLADTAAVTYAFLS